MKRFFLSGVNMGFTFCGRIKGPKAQSGKLASSWQKPLQGSKKNIAVVNIAIKLKK
jgi:hypothetical protein